MRDEGRQEKGKEGEPGLECKTSLKRKGKRKVHAID